MAIILPGQNQTLPLGAAYDSIKSDQLQESMVLDTYPPTVGQKTTWYLSEVSTLQQLRDDLQIDASASWSSLIGGASIRASFADESEIDSATYCLLVRCYVENSSQSLKSYDLTKAASDILAKDHKQFYASFGDSFISARSTGGEYLAMLQWHTETASDRQSLSAAFSGSLGSFSTEADYRSALSKINFSYGAVAIQRRIGGIGALPNYDAVSIVNYSLGFPAQVAIGTNADVVLYATTESYQRANNLPPRSQVILVDQMLNKLGELAKDESAAELKLNDIQYALEHKDQFDQTQYDRQALSIALAGVQAALSNIEADARGILQDPFAPLPTRAYPLPDINTERLLRNTITLKIWTENQNDNTGVAGKTLLTSSGDWTAAYQTGLRLEAMAVSIEPTMAPNLILQYMGHLASIGDTGWINEGDRLGTVGEWRRLEGFAINLSGRWAKDYTIEYKADVSDINENQMPIFPFIDSRFYIVPPSDMHETGKSTNGQFCGTRGEAKRLDAISIKITRNPGA